MPPIKSFVPVPEDSDFSIHNLPFGIITHPGGDSPRPAVAIGDHALDLQIFTDNNGFSALSPFQPHQHVFTSTSTPGRSNNETLNAFAALGRPMHKLVRSYLQSILSASSPFPDVLETNQSLREKTLIPLADCTLHLPMRIGDYTDFYAGRHHAQRVGELFRGPTNALQPNYLHLPVGYHGRASSVVVSGTPVVRPVGQILPSKEAKEPIVAPSRKLDFELELGYFICGANKQGSRVGLREAQAEFLFGMVLLNDWSARDIQAWEYVPLGPFNSKNFATTVSGWVVLAEALEPFRTSGLVRKDEEPKPPKYMDEEGATNHYDMNLTVSIRRSQSTEVAGSQVTRTNATNLLYSFPQMAAHHTLGGCPLNVGDLFGSGTISGTDQGTRGCLLEATRNATPGEELVLRSGEKRAWVLDGDEVVIEGHCVGRVGSEDAVRVGFGKCAGVVLPTNWSEEEA